MVEGHVKAFHRRCYISPLPIFLSHVMEYFSTLKLEILKNSVGIVDEKIMGLVLRIKAQFCTVSWTLTGDFRVFSPIIVQLNPSVQFKTVPSTSERLPLNQLGWQKPSPLSLSLYFSRDQFQFRHN